MSAVSSACAGRTFPLPELAGLPALFVREPVRLAQVVGLVVVWLMIAAVAGLVALFDPARSTCWLPRSYRVPCARQEMPLPFRVANLASAGPCRVLRPLVGAPPA